MVWSLLDQVTSTEERAPPKAPALNSEKASAVRRSLPLAKAAPRLGGGGEALLARGFLPVPEGCGDTGASFCLGRGRRALRRGRGSAGAGTGTGRSIRSGFSISSKPSLEPSLLLLLLPPPPYELSPSRASYDDSVSSPLRIMTSYDVSSSSSFWAGDALSSSFHSSSLVDAEDSASPASPSPPSVRQA